MKKFIIISLLGIFACVNPTEPFIVKEVRLTRFSDTKYSVTYRSMDNEWNNSFNTDSIYQVGDTLTFKR